MREDSSNRPSPPSAARKLSPEDIALPPGYEIDVFAHGLTTPINLIFTPEGEMLVADA